MGSRGTGLRRSRRSKSGFRKISRSMSGVRKIRRSKSRVRKSMRSKSGVRKNRRSKQWFSRSTGIMRRRRCSSMVALSDIITSVVLGRNSDQSSPDSLQAAATPGQQLASNMFQISKRRKFSRISNFIII